MSDIGTELSIAATETGVVLAGEIDAHTAPELERALNDGLQRMPTLRVDMRDVTFMDSSGLRVLIGVTNTARDPGGDLVIVEPTVVIRRLVEISGLQEHLTITGG